MWPVKTQPKLTHVTLLMNRMTTYGLPLASFPLLSLVE